MNLGKRNNITNKFLLIMKQVLDKEPRTPYFDFKFKGTGNYAGRSVSENPEGKYLTQLKQQIKVSDQEFKEVLNYCYNQGYIYGSQEYIRLTDKGREQANKFESEPTVIKRAIDWILNNFILGVIVGVFASVITAFVMKHWNF